MGVVSQRIDFAASTAAYPGKSFRFPPLGSVPQSLVIAGAGDEAQAAWNEEQVRSALAELLSQGLDKKEAIKRVAKAAHWPRRQVYKVAVDES